MKLSNIKSNSVYDLVHGLPQQLEKDGDGSYLFRYNIAEHYNENNELDGYSCVEIRFKEQPTKQNLKRIVVRSIIDENDEFKLINAYNKYVLKINTDVKSVNNYKEYLKLLDDIDNLLSNF